MKRVKTISSGSMRLSLLLLISILLVVGSVWARYQAKVFQEFDYALKDYSFVYLWHSYNEETESFLDRQTSWQTEGEQKTLDFCVSNGTADSYAKDDQRVNVRLLVSLGAWNGTESMTVHLHLPQTGERFQGTVQPIVENSPVHCTFGEGWTITFCEAEGEEAGWTLKGSELSYVEMQIVLEDTQLLDTTLMQLQVVGDAEV